MKGDFMGRSQLYVGTLGLWECGHLERYNIDNKKKTKENISID